MDKSEIALAATKALIEAAAKPIAAHSKLMLSSIVGRLTSSLSDFLTQTYYRVSTYRTLVNPNEPVDLLDGFTKLNLRVGNQKTDEQGFVDRIRPGIRFIVTAPAGQGKSLLMKYVAFSQFENHTAQIPLFIELREMNRSINLDILAFIYSTYVKKTRYTLERFRKDMASGHFVLLLDGFDELSPRVRAEVEKSILDLSRQYTRTSILVSSRYDSSIFAWDRFTVCRILPMSKVQAIGVVKKLKYNEGLKRNFIKIVRDGLYEEHLTFMSNPLLTTLMLFIYEQFAKIPEKAHILYEQAFETLLRRHDALKAQFSRELYSALPHDDLKAIFTVFCALSYADSQFSFDNAELNNYIERALKYRHMEVEPARVARDFVESLCVLQPDGLSTVFVHRSFQEHFCAVFLSSLDRDTRFKLLTAFAVRRYDNAILNLYGMKPEMLETEWLIPQIETMLSRFGMAQTAVARLQTIADGVGVFTIGKKVYLNDAIGGNHAGIFNVVNRLFGERSTVPTACDFAHYIRDNKAANAFQSLIAAGDDRFDAPSAVREDITPGRPIRFYQFHWRETDEKLVSSLGLEQWVHQNVNLCRDVLNRITAAQKVRTEVLSDLIDGRKH